MPQGALRSPFVIIAACLLVILIVLGFGSQLRFLSSMRTAGDQTGQMIDRTRILLRLFVDAETGQRGFLITRDETYLQPFEQARAKLQGVVADLRALAAPSAGDTAALTRVGTLWREKETELLRTIELARLSDEAGVRSLVMDGSGKRIMDNIRAELENLIERKKVLQTAQHSTLIETESLLTWIIAGLLVLGVAGLALSLILMQRRNKSLVQLNTAQADSAAALKRTRDALAGTVEMTRAELAGTARRLGATLASAPISISIQDRQLTYTWVSGRGLGHDPEWFLGKNETDILNPPARDIMVENKTNVLSSGQALSFEVQLPKAVGAAWYEVRLEPTHDTAGSVDGIMSVYIDISERKQREQQIRLLMHELAHRSKNTLAVVQAIARQTAAGASNTAQFIDNFSLRLNGLAATHSLLVEERWSGAGLEDLIRSQLGHYTDLLGTQVLMTGPAITLPSEFVQNIGLAIHELATNAAKYGALSTEAGRVDIAWTLDADTKAVKVDWRESGGPLVVPPKRSGFGRNVIERTIARTLNGSVDIAYPPEGFRWSLTFTLPAAHSPVY